MAPNIQGVADLVDGCKCSGACNNNEWDDCKQKAIKLIKEISDSSTCGIIHSNFLDKVIVILREKL